VLINYILRPTYLLTYLYEIEYSEFSITIRNFNCCTYQTLTYGARVRVQIPASIARYQSSAKEARLPLIAGEACRCWWCYIRAGILNRCATWTTVSVVLYRWSTTKSRTRQRPAVCFTVFLWSEIREFLCLLSRNRLPTTWFCQATSLTVFWFDIQDTMTHWNQRDTSERDISININFTFYHYPYLYIVLTGAHTVQIYSCVK